MQIPIEAPMETASDHTFPGCPICLNSLILDKAYHYPFDESLNIASYFSCSHPAHLTCISQSIAAGNVVCRICGVSFADDVIHSFAPDQKGATTNDESSKSSHMVSDRKKDVEAVVEPSPGELASIKAVPEYSSYRMPNPENRVLISALVSVKAPLPTEQQRSPIDLVAVVDVSGSMVKQTLRYPLAVMPHPGDRLGIISFNISGVVQAQLGPIGERKRLLTNVTEGLRAGGGTALWSGMELGLQILGEHRDSSWNRLLGISEHTTSKHVSSMFVFSDGQDNYAAPESINISSQSLGIWIVRSSPLGTEPTTHRNCLPQSQEVEELFTYMSDISVVQDALAAGLGAAMSINMHHIWSTVDSLPEEMSSDGRKATVSIPNLFADEDRDIFVELLVNANYTEVLTVNGSYSDKDNSRQTRSYPLSSGVNAANGGDVSAASKIIKMVLSSIVEKLVKVHGSSKLSDRVQALRAAIKPDTPSDANVKIHRLCFDAAIRYFDSGDYDALHVESFNAIYDDLESVHDATPGDYSNQKQQDIPKVSVQSLGDDIESKSFVKA
ncbi:hypothetical protein BJ742DRAFT_866841 [Cladochytrium replicatum]|nr:hypothetical protein BJ742DRAFT_866841 [Cladochytrium replicatum]